MEENKALNMNEKLNEWNKHESKALNVNKKLNE